MWGGHHIHLGRNVYINFNCTLVDDAQITIGDGTMIAPNVTIVAASHPVSPKLGAEGCGITSWQLGMECGRQGRIIRRCGR